MLIPDFLTQVHQAKLNPKITENRNFNKLLIHVSNT